MSGAGDDVALNFMIDVSRLNYMAYVRSYHGAQILIHEPNAYPEASISKAISQPGYEAVITVKASVVHSDPGIRSLSLDQRDCLFPDEVFLLHLINFIRIFVLNDEKKTIFSINFVPAIHIAINHA